MKSIIKSLLVAAAIMPATAILAQSPTDGEVIDLGLSVNWRGYNLGASSPEELGNVYPWGYTAAGDLTSRMSYSFFNWDTYAVNLPSSEITGDPDYDAATKALGELWSTPTRAQWQELIDNCDITLSEEGALLVSKINGNSIYLPKKTPGRRESVIYQTSESDGSNMSYYAEFSSWANEVTTNYTPWTGYPVRPVCTGEIEPIESIALTAEKTELWAGTGMTLTATPTPAVDNFNPSWKSSDKSVATVSGGKLEAWAPGTATITASAGGAEASIVITVTAVDNDDADGVVDMGLSVDWLTTNEGASAPSEVGSRYPFGYTTPGRIDSWNYIFDTPSGELKFPFTTACGNPDYDAVAKNSDGAHRLPSLAEMRELVDNCYLQAITVDGVSCVRFTSLVNGRQLLFPAKYDYWAGDVSVNKNAATGMSVKIDASEPNVTVMASRLFCYDNNPLRGVSEKSSTVPLEGIVVTASKPTVYAENSITVTATAAPVGAVLSDGLVWSSSDPSIAVVSAAGKVTGVAPGEVDIIATDGDISGSVTITVEEVYVCQNASADMGTDKQWATALVGATEPGGWTFHHFYWGMTERASSDGGDWTDPGVDDIAGTAHDPATAHLGAGWATPTMDDYRQLRDACAIEWIVYKGNKGARLISTETGESIFIPLPSLRDHIFLFASHKTGSRAAAGIPGMFIWENSPNVDLNQIQSANSARQVLAVTHEAVDTGIDEIAADGGAAAPAEYYNLQGIRVDNPAPGSLYIRRQGSTTEKVIVK